MKKILHTILMLLFGTPLLSQTITNVEIDPPLCYGLTGVLEIQASGGTPPLVYSVGGGDTFQSDNYFFVFAGIYDVVVQDALGNEDTEMVTVEGIPVLEVSLLPIHPTCPNNFDGSISMIGSGGTPPLLYSLDGTFFQQDTIFSFLAEGNYSVWIQDSYGCVAVNDITLASTGGIDFQMLQTNEVLSLDIESNNVSSIQWFTCINGNQVIIEGETDETFTASVNGYYGATLISSSGCAITTDCFLVSATSINEELEDDDIPFIYPNPTNEILNISLGNKLKDVEVQIIDTNGKILYTQNNVESQELNLNIGNLIGVFIVQIITDTKIFSYKVVN